MTPRYTAADYLKAANCIYIAVDKPVADEIAAMLRQAAAEVTRLTAQWEALKANVREGDAVNTRYGEQAFTLCDVLTQMTDLEAQR